MTDPTDPVPELALLCIGVVAVALENRDVAEPPVLSGPYLATIGQHLSEGIAGSAGRAAERAIRTAWPDHSGAKTVQKRLSDTSLAIRFPPHASREFARTGALAGALAQSLATVLAEPDDRAALAGALSEGLAACHGDSWLQGGVTANLLRDAIRAADERSQRDAAQDRMAHDQTHAMLAELLRRTGGPSAALAAPETLTPEDLATLATAFGGDPTAPRAALLDFLGKKAEEYAAYRDQIDRIDDRVKGLDNLKAAAKDAAERLDFDEVEEVLARVDEVETEIAAETKEARAANALLRGQVDQAFAILSAAADSFGGIDPVEPARRRARYYEPLYDHGSRYGGPGLTRAVDMLRAALTVLTEDAHPFDWARAQNDLGNALAYQGNRTGGAAGAAFLADAVTAFRAALRVGTEESYPRNWAMTQNNLGNALHLQGYRIGGPMGAELLAEAAAAYRAALRVWSEDVHSANWAMTQNNLGNTLTDMAERNVGRERGVLLEEAVVAYEAALRVYTEDAHGSDWSMALNNLGVALKLRGQHSEGAEGTEYLARAIAACDAALRVWTETDHPLNWAGTQSNLGAALRCLGERTEGVEGAALLQRAIAAQSAALRVRTEETHPVGWAGTIENIAIAEFSIASHDSCTDPRPPLERSLSAVTESLRVYDLEHMPYHYDKATQLRDKITARLASLP